MPTINVTINDTLQERCEAASQELYEHILGFDTLHAALEWMDEPYDEVHQFADSNTPIYTSEIKDTWYLHSEKLKEAYENAGFGENPLENNGMTGIYCYIQNWLQEEIGSIHAALESASEENWKETIEKLQKTF